MIVEQITYVLHPGRAPILAAAYEDQGLAVIARNLGRLIGWYIAEVGGMDEVTQLWAFTDAADREARHAALAADPEWKAFTSEHGHLLVSRRNVLWRPTAFSPATA
jgi:hypothetical protein